MARIDPIPRDEMSPEQIRVNDEIASVRSGGQALGPFAVWLRTPELAQKIGVFGNHIRTKSALPPRLLELAVATVARSWSAQYEWYAHEPHARDAGLEPELLEDIRLGRKPAFSNAEDELVHGIVLEMLENRTLGDASYRKALDLLGEQQVIDLLTVIGYYTMIAVVLVGLEVDTPDGSRPFPPTTA